MTRDLAIAALCILAAIGIVIDGACQPSIPYAGHTAVDASDSGYVTITVTGYDAGGNPGY